MKFSGDNTTARSRLVGGKGRFSSAVLAASLAIHGGCAHPPARPNTAVEQTSRADPNLVARVGSTGIPRGAATSGDLANAVFTRMFEDYASRNGISASRDEVDAVVQRLAGNAVTDPEFVSFVDGVALSWKVDRAMHSQYGGRCVYYLFAPTWPIDAYRAFVLEEEALGAVVFYDAAVRDALLSALDVRGKPVVEARFDEPWWLWSPEDPATRGPLQR